MVKKDLRVQSSAFEEKIAGQIIKTLVKAAESAEALIVHFKKENYLEEEEKDSQEQAGNWLRKKKASVWPADFHSNLSLII
jgi:hypothetical protein